MADLEKLKKTLVQYGDTIKQDLGLHEWRIGVRFVLPQELDNPTAYAEAHTSASYLEGEILVNSFTLERLSVDSWKEKLWHEYVHVLHAPIEELLDKWAKGPYVSQSQYLERQEEQRQTIEPIVERLGRYLYASHSAPEHKTVGLLAGVKSYINRERSKQDG